jgi:transposase
MIEAAAPRTIKTRLWGILSAIQLKTTTAIAESVNPTIQKIKARACGFRHRPRSRMAILFDKRGGALLPAGISEGTPHESPEVPN